MDAGRRDAGDERVAQGGIEVSALRRPGLRTAPVVAATVTLAAATIAAAAAAAVALTAATAPHRLTASTVCDHG
jgi:hypothetical protein